MIILEEQFSPRVNPADENYPFGSIKDNTSPGANDGTPLAAVWGNDWEGFAQAAMTEAGITPSGLPDTAQDSQLLAAVKVVASGALRPSVIEALRRSYAEAGYNLVDGSFEAGGTLVNANDVLLQERTGKAFSGPAGVVADGTNPESGGFVDVSGNVGDITLRSELIAMDGAGLVGAGNYGYIDSYTGDSSHIKCYGVNNAFDGGHGDFYLDASDTASPSSGVCRVDALGRRWKRQVTGDFDWRWWGVKGDGVADDWAAISKMISDVNVFSGPSGVFAISQPLPIAEGLRVVIVDNAGANAAGLIKPHSSVTTPSAFDFFFADSVQVEHVNISGLRFFGGRHVIRGNFPSGVSSGFISQVNFEDCVFQDLTGYVIESTNSVFVIDFHKCRLLRCGGVNIGYGVNILKFRQCGFENMRREYIKLDGAGSTLPSASIGLYGCRCEGYDTSPTASKCFDISGYGRIFNFEITEGTYFENVFTDIGTISGVKGLNLNNLNLTNSDNRVYTLNITDCTGVIGNFESLVSAVVTLSGSSAIEQVGDISGGVTVRTLGASSLKSDLRIRKEVTAPAVTALYRFNCLPTGSSGASVFSASGGKISVTYVSSRTDDGTPIFSSKTFEVIVTKMFGGIMAATVFETGNVGNLGGGSLTLTSSGATETEITLSLAFTGSGSYSAGAVITAEANMKPVSASENTIYVTRA